MNIGIIGLGKLGLPLALAIESKGHIVRGYDTDPNKMNTRPRKTIEQGLDNKVDLNEDLKKSQVEFVRLDDLVDESEIIFVAVQTPHESMFEGIMPIEESPRDFSYEYLIEALSQISEYLSTPKLIVIVSTVLPGTVARITDQIKNPLMQICYNPSFIAMGTTIRDFLFPEFVLIGGDDENAKNKLVEFYQTITDSPIRYMTIESAELTKVAYNTFIGMKLAFTNTLMEICHKIPNADVDEVTDTLKKANNRLISPAYMTAGMGDGGGCHPRDNIAMSWLSAELELSYDLFSSMTQAREKQTDWLANLLCSYDLPKAILGYAYKPQTNITTGSAAMLLKSMLESRGHKVQLYDHYVEERPIDLTKLAPHVFLIGCRHPEYANIEFPKGSIVIDPWRMVDKNTAGIDVVTLGSKH
ncbi:MAG: nucleotide sugar dehydrogenase [Alteromonadaceae bacterium]|nr:nucleotide sugar dehydrogenase [Alteromonadaceae bacterium]